MVFVGVGGVSEGVFIVIGLMLLFGAVGKFV